MSNVTLEWINTFYEIATYAVNVLICLYMSITMIFNSSNVRKYFCNWWQILSYQLIDNNWSEFDALEIIKNILLSRTFRSYQIVRPLVWDWWDSHLYFLLFSLRRKLKLLMISSKLISVVVETRKIQFIISTRHIDIKIDQIII